MNVDQSKKPYCAPQVLASWKARGVHAFQLRGELPEVPPEGWYISASPDVPGVWLVEHGWQVAPCPGSAHTAEGGYPHVDNCETCAPLWGVLVIEDAPATPRDGST